MAVKYVPGMTIACLEGRHGTSERVPVERTEHGGAILRFEGGGCHGMGVHEDGTDAVCTCECHNN